MIEYSMKPYRMDVRKFYESIDKKEVLRKAKELIKDPRLLGLVSGSLPMGRKYNLGLEFYHYKKKNK